MNRAGSAVIVNLCNEGRVAPKEDLKVELCNIQDILIFLYFFDLTLFSLGGHGSLSLSPSACAPANPMLKEVFSGLIWTNSERGKLFRLNYIHIVLDLLNAPL